MDENKRIIEINGVRLEVDLRSARRIDEFRVGDSVKVLDNRSGKNEMKAGVITDFANFKDLPTLIVAVYRAGDYWSKPSIEFITFNSETEGFDDEIAKKRDELNDLIIKRDTFVKYFGRAQA